MNKSEDVKKFVLSCLEGSNSMNHVARKSFAYYGDRCIRDVIRSLRLQGYYIVGDTKTGGYYLGTECEWDCFCEQQRRRAINNFYKKSSENSRQLLLTVLN